MKIINRKTTLLGAALLSLGATPLLTHSVQAAPRGATPRSQEVKQERRDVKQARQEVKHERRDVKQANTPFQRRQEQQDLNRARRDLGRERQDLRQDRFPNRPGFNNRPNVGNRPTLNNQPSYNGGGNYSGTVIRVSSNQSFDINIGGNTFNVYTLSRLPLGLSAGDQVRVNGVQQFNNDIRNARVTLVRNR